MFSVITPLALGWIASTALLLKQGRLWVAEMYWGLSVAALMLTYAAARMNTWGFTLTWLDAFPFVRGALALFSRASA